MPSSSSAGLWPTPPWPGSEAAWGVAVEHFKILTRRDMEGFLQALCRFLQKTEQLLIALEAVRQQFDEGLIQTRSLSALIKTLEDGADELKLEIDALEAATRQFLGELRQPGESVPVFVLRISLILNDPDLLHACLRRNNRMLV